MNLDEFDLRQCQECGKLIQLAPGHRLCTACLGPEGGEFGAREEAVGSLLDSVADFAGLKAGAMPLSWMLQETESTLMQLTTKQACGRCNLRPRLQDSEFCLNCQVDLTSDLGDAATDLFYGVGTSGPAARNRPTGMAIALEEKRGRAPLGRINPVVVGRLKT